MKPIQLGVCVAFFLLSNAASSSSEPKFSVSDDGLEVTDSRTHLIWRRCPEGMLWDGGRCRGAAGAYRWNEARRRVKDAGSGWRLPTVDELSSIVDMDQRDYEKHHPAIDLTIFPDTPAAWFWTSSRVQGNSKNYWAVNFRGGDSGHDEPDDRINLRLVRTGQ